MKPKEFELRIIKAIKSRRIKIDVKQLNVATALGMSDSNYCKIERGEKAITIQQLRKVSEYLNCSYLEILWNAEFETKE